MTPVASWTPADYHRAVNRDRAAWQATQPQLTIPDLMDGLDRAPDECRRRPVEPASSPAGSQMAGEPCRSVPDRFVVHDRQIMQTTEERSTRGQDASSPAYTTTREAGANHIPVKRARLQKGV